MANGTLMPSPVFTGLDNTGTPLSGGKLYTYIAGTTTPQATYSNVGLTTPNANPVVLDSAGRGTVFLTPGASYKLVLKTSADATVWTQDNVSAVPTSTASLDITGTAGEDLAEREVVYLADGTGGTTAGRWYRASSGATGTSTLAKQLGVAVSGVLTGQSGSIRIGGSVSGYAGLTTGAAYYVAASSGTLTSTPPANARIVGVADSTTSLVLDVHSTLGAVTVGGALTVVGALSSASAAVTGNATVGGTLGVTGAATVGGTLGVTGTTTLAGVTLTGGARVDVTTTGTINDLALSTAFRSGMNIVLRMNNASDATINGIAGGVDGALLTVQSIGAGKVYLAHQNVGSTASNRLLNVLTSGNTPLAAGGSAVYVYDNASGRWRLIAHEQGAFISYTPSLTNITLGNGTLSGRYYVRGLDVRVDISLALGSTSSVTGQAKFSVPYTASGITSYHPSVAVGYHGGTGLSTGTFALNTGTSAFSVNRVTDVESANGWDATTPWAWGSGDSMSLAGVYTTS